MSDPNNALIWRKRCGTTSCLEVARGTTVIYVRDSTNPDGPRLVFTPDAWAVFVAGIRSVGIFQ